MNFDKETKSEFFFSWGRGWGEGGDAAEYFLVWGWGWGGREGG